jgi:protein-tyrosine-phosphatase
MPEAIATLRERGVDIGSHRSRPLDPKEVEEADLVVGMTSVHVRELLDAVPEVAPKVVLLKALAEITGPVGGASAAERLEALLGAPRPEWRRALDIDDPIGLPLSAYEKCVAEIQAGVDALADLLCGKDKGETDPPR